MNRGLCIIFVYVKVRHSVI